MNLNRTFGLALALATVAQATGADTQLGPKETPALQPRTAANPLPPAEFERISLEAKASALGKGTVHTAAAHPANPVASPGKEERLASWQALPPSEAYQLFKELGREMPRELALQFNTSLTVNPWNDALRQAGGSPMTALPIVNTNPGDTYSDSGNTVVLSNYLGNVPYISIPCNQISGFYANDAWYTFTIAAPTQVNATTCGGVIGFDTILGVFNTSLEMVASNDDNCGVFSLHSTLDCCLEPGTYYLVVDGFGGGAGAYDLDVSFNTCPAGPGITRGGPDGFGYTWINSADAGGPDYDMVDISGIGTPVTLSDDSYTTTPVALGFTFPFYGTGYTDLYIGSNGFVGFDPAAMFSLGNTVLPNAGAPNNLIAAFWDDLNPGAGGAIHTYYESWTGRFFIQYTNVPAFGAGGAYTFQIILHQGGDIVIHYFDLQDNDISEATVGIENATGNDGLTVNYNGNGATLGDFTTVRFRYPRPTSGGPDAFGYTWANSNDLNGPVSRYQDISWATNLGITGDDQPVDVALPWAFPYYGNSYSSIRVTSNGWLGFNTDYAEYFGMPIPSTNPPNNTIFALQDDLLPPAGGAVYFLDESYLDRVVFSWQGIPNINGSLPYNFQVELYRDGRIFVNYADISENFVGTTTVGLENIDGTVGLQVAHDGAGATLEDNLTLRFTPPQPRPTRGGPAAGYEWVNSLDPAGPDYMFSDISGVGLNLNLVGDDNSVIQSLPFAFPFFGSHYTAVNACTNGWLSFNLDTPAHFNNQSVPGPGVVDNAILAFWDDLIFNGPAALYYLDDSAHGRVIFQWNQVAHFASGDGPYTFQVMLYSNGEIYLNYGDLGLNLFYGTASATVGVENADGSAGLQVNFNDAGSLIASGVTIAIAPVTRKPAAITDLRIVQDAVTNGQPFLYHYEWSPVTTDVNGNTLNVDYYDFYYTFGLNPYAPFPSGWNYFAPFYGTNTGTITHYVDDIAVRIVAVDTDGFVMSNEATTGAAPLRAETLRSMARQGVGTVLSLTPATQNN